MKKYKKVYQYNIAFETLKNKLQDDSYGICPAPIDDRTAINILVHYLIPDLQISVPLNVEQANLVIVKQILDKYSKEWRRDWKEFKKSNGRK